MDFLTTGDIAKELGADRDKVAYALRKTKTEPIGRAGLVRLFSGNALSKVRDFLDSKTEKRTELAADRGLNSCPA